MALSRISMASRAADVLWRLPLYRAYRAFDWPALLPLSMSFVVTDKCNSLCKTCLIGKRYLDDPSVADGELTLDEYARLFRAMGRPRWITLSGGEPFMRRDLPDLVIELARAVSPWVINVPTNGTLVETTTAAVERILPQLGETQLVINVSVDGVGEQHDEVRGCSGNFRQLTSAIAALRALGDPRLTIGVNTVVSRHNVEHFEEIVAHVLERIRPDSYVVEPAQIRAEYHNQGEDLAAADAAVDRALGHLDGRTPARGPGLARVISAFRREYYASILRGMPRGRGRRGHACWSSFASVAVMPKGDVWSSTQRAELMGSLREHAYDLAALLRSEQARTVRARVRAAECRCETANTSTVNALLEPRALARIAWRYLFSS